MFSFKRVIIPILIGIGFSAFSLLSNHFDFSVLRGIEWCGQFIVLAFLMMFIRDMAYIWRLQILTGKALRFKDAFQIIMLWEFASSVSPSMVGGSAFAIFFINAEGIPLGRSTGIVLTTALLDELFYIIMVALILAVSGISILNVSGLPFNPTTLFLIGYGFIILLTTIIAVGIFIAPHGLKKVLVGLFSLPLLRRWKAGAERTGDEIIMTLEELKGKRFGYWFKAFFATAFSWTARYCVLNCLILALNPQMGFDWGHQVMIYAKQLIMWVILLISPTPGASGIAEISFTAFFGNEFTANIADAVALLWRGISYYPYLFIGLAVLPWWLTKLEKRRLANKEIHNSQCTMHNSIHNL